MFSYYTGQETIENLCIYLCDVCWYKCKKFVQILKICYKQSTWFKGLDISPEDKQFGESEWEAKYR